MSLQSSPPLNAGTKRAYRHDQHGSEEEDEEDANPTSRGATTPAVTSAFRNVSACHRCRGRKNRCDQRLPACAACERVHARCVGFDPITKKEIPRSYVYYLEKRLTYLESRLAANNVDFDPPDAYNGTDSNLEDPTSSAGRGAAIAAGSDGADVPATASLSTDRRRRSSQTQDDADVNKIVSDIGMVSVHGTSDNRYLGSTSGITFARVVLSAIKRSGPKSKDDTQGDSSHTESTAEPHGRTPTQASIAHGSSMRECYFGLSTKSADKEAPFPDQELAEQLVHLYFEHANPQIPILHRTEFTDLLRRAYSSDPSARTPRDLYLLNIVFAIGAGTIFGASDEEAEISDRAASAPKRTRIAGRQRQPEEYHAAAIVHLSSFLGSMTNNEYGSRSGGDLEDLQGILLLAGYALLRPVSPGLWYIVGVAMRLAIDLGLHHEDGTHSASAGISSGAEQSRLQHMASGPRSWSGDVREYKRDMRRRLWWCTYCFDRLVSTCVGRPFGITDSVITTEFPSLLDDRYITRDGVRHIQAANEPCYKRVAHHYLRLRLLQSEILQVLQYQQAQQTRIAGANSSNPFVHKNVPSPFLVQYRDFRSWRYDVDQRLFDWKESAPSKKETGVGFSPQFLELNYWQAVIMLYRNSLSVPEPLVRDVSPTEEVSTPTSPPAEDREDQEMVFLKCAEAGQQTLKLYRQLHRLRLVNYTYLATHHLFMAGISFLYAIWHSPTVRSRLTFDDFDFTVLAATSVLSDLMKKCPPARAYSDAFERMARTTIQMCASAPGFGLGSAREQTPTPTPTPTPSGTEARQFGSDVGNVAEPTASYQMQARRPPPHFDYNLHELFPKDLDVRTRPSQAISRSAAVAQRIKLAQRRFGGSELSRQRKQVHGRQRSSSNTSNPMQDPGGLSSPLPPSHSYFNFEGTSSQPDFMSNVGMNFLNSLGHNRSDIDRLGPSSQPHSALSGSFPFTEDGAGSGFHTGSVPTDGRSEPNFERGPTAAVTFTASPDLNFNAMSDADLDMPMSFDASYDDGLESEIGSVTGMAGMPELPHGTASMYDGDPDGLDFNFGVGMGIGFDSANFGDDVTAATHDMDGFFFGGHGHGYGGPAV